MFYKFHLTSVMKVWDKGASGNKLRLHWASHRVFACVFSDSLVAITVAEPEAGNRVSLPMTYKRRLREIQPTLAGMNQKKSFFFWLGLASPLVGNRKWYLASQVDCFHKCSSILSNGWEGGDWRCKRGFEKVGFRIHSYVRGAVKEEQHLSRLKRVEAA